MKVTDMREHVYAAYSGDRWKAKVRSMSDNQVMAIYFRLLQKGTIKGAAR